MPSVSSGKLSKCACWLRLFLHSRSCELGRSLLVPGEWSEPTWRLQLTQKGVDVAKRPRRNQPSLADPGTRFKRNLRQRPRKRLPEIDAMHELGLVHKPLVKRMLRLLQRLEGTPQIVTLQVDDGQIIMAFACW